MNTSFDKDKVGTYNVEYKVKDQMVMNLAISSP